MPNIYVNSEAQTANNKHAALKCVVDAAKCLKKFDEYINSLHLREGINMQIYKDKSGNMGYIQELLGISGNNRDYLRYLLAKLSDAHYSKSITKSNWIVEILGVPNNWLHYVANHNGMLLTFASDDIWKIDFIKFIGQENKIPNIWGQEDTVVLLNWVKDEAIKTDSYITTLQKNFNVIICSKSIEVETFDDTKAGTLCELVVTGSIRIFFAKNDKTKKIFVGGFYIKGTGNDKKAQDRVAYKAKNKINSHYMNSM